MSFSEKVWDNYKIIRSIGKGAFGTVYLTYAENGTYYASKVELRQDSSRLIEEYKIYRNLNKRGFKFCHGLPNVYALIQTPKINLMVMELLGPNIESMFIKYDKVFNLETIVSLGINLVNLLERLHNAGYIHRDIKPANFLLGYGKNYDKIYLTDFGLSKQYVKNGSHIPYVTGRNLVGTLRYASINVHLGYESSRRDDMESLGYMLIYLSKGSLPWQGLKKRKDVEQVEIIGNAKMCTSVSKLCDGLHPNFRKYIKLCRDLKFEEKPNYKALRECFSEIAESKKLVLKYQWVNKLACNNDSSTCSDSDENLCSDKSSDNSENSDS